jgi:FkbM family methyltransferase
MVLRDQKTRATLVYRAWRYRVLLDRMEIRWMRSVLRPGDFALDVGAHKGAYTYWMRRTVGPRGRIVAMEPQPDLAGYLRDVAATAGWRNVVVENMGLSSSDGTGELLVPGEGTSPGATFLPGAAPEGARRMTVPVASLDGYLERTHRGHQVRLVKCDVEGVELEVFRGARRTLVSHRPLLLFECEARHDPTRDVQDVFGFLHGLGYAGYFFWKGRRCPLEDFDLAVHQVVGRRPYVNNFVFEPGRA